MNIYKHTVWVGTYGDYLIPAELQDVKITKTGWPDLRYKRAGDLLAWVAEQEALAAGNV